MTNTRKKSVSNIHVRRSAPQMTISEADRQLFRAQVADATPLSSKDSLPLKQPTAPMARRFAWPTPVAVSPTEIDSSAVATMAIDTPVAAETFLKYHWTRLSRHQRRLLQQGALLIDAQVDLHQCTVVQAYEQLLQFIQCCQSEARQWGLVIHGKGLHSQAGYPVLKNYVNQWLRQINVIKAFCSAHPRHGGNGAVYVFL
ncbi:MAG: hypothetical protein GKR77_07285 [Legionellales bacterium]|nr:hypothetical protein [Legionellales bacterium]